MNNKITNVEKIKTAKDIQRISLEVLKKDAKFLAILEDIEKEAKRGSFHTYSNAIITDTTYKLALESLGYNVQAGYIYWNNVC